MIDTGAEASVILESQEPDKIRQKHTSKFNRMVVN